LPAAFFSEDALSLSKRKTKDEMADEMIDDLYRTALYSGTKMCQIGKSSIAMAENFMRVVFLSLLFLAAPAWAGEREAEFARFFGVDEKRIFVECRDESFEFRREAGASVLNMCLRPGKHGTRCEVAIHDLPRAPRENIVSFDVRQSDDVPRKRWHSVMQIHSFPDKGEIWRCPVMALEVEENRFRMFNRWDREARSVAVGYDCAGAGSTLQSRQVFGDVAVRPGAWQTVKMNAVLSWKDDGRLRAGVDGHGGALLEGPNIYNDRRGNFLKFGIYKPTGWEAGHDKVCVDYRNVRIETDRP
jgi:hypothetical protein